MARQKVEFDFGEKRHVRTSVEVVTGGDLPFLIRTAKWELIDDAGTVEDSGECLIDEQKKINIHPAVYL